MLLNVSEYVFEIETARGKKGSKSLPKAVNSIKFTRSLETFIAKHLNFSKISAEYQRGMIKLMKI